MKKIVARRSRLASRKKFLSLLAANQNLTEEERRQAQPPASIANMVSYAANRAATRDSSKPQT
jgi:hypothetical protein